MRLREVSFHIFNPENIPYKNQFPTILLLKPWSIFDLDATYVGLGLV